MAWIIDLLINSSILQTFLNVPNVGQHRAVVEAAKVIVSTLGHSLSRVREKYQTHKQIVVTIEMGALLDDISW